MIFHPKLKDMIKSISFILDVSYAKILIIYRNSYLKFPVTPALLVIGKGSYEELYCKRQQ